MSAALVLHARIHDHQSPSHAHDWKAVVAMYADGSTQPMTWYGEYLWRGNGQGATMVCATDRANNTTCAPVTAAPDDAGVTTDAPTNVKTQPGGCCDAGGESPFALLLLVSARIRSTRRRCGSAPRRRRSA